MKNTSIKAKLFTVILLTFTLLIGIILIGSSYFFEPYYVNKKIKSLKSEMVLFADQNIVANENSKLRIVSESEPTQNMEQFFESTESPLVIMKPGKQLVYPKNSFTIKIQDGEKQILVDIYYLILELQDQGVELKNGMEVSFRGSWEAEKFIAIYPDKIDGKKLLSEEDVLELEELQDLKTLRGTIVSNEIPKYDSGYVYKQETLLYLIDKYSEKNEQIIPYHDGATGINSYLIRIPHGDNTLFSLFTTQPVDDVISSMPEFLKYVLAIAIALTLVISLIITKLIVRPIVGIRKISGKMAKLDFSERIKVKSKDEIGLLSMDLNFMADELQNMIDELETSNTKLRAELEKEKQLEQSRKNFVADASHELKTPLGIIQAYGERIMDKYELDENMEKYMDVILDEQRKMNKLIDDLLELSKLESMTYRLKFESYDIIAEIEEIGARLRALFNEKSIKLNFCLEQELYINADKEKLNQVISNILSNAFKYTPETQNIWIETKQLEDKVELVVSNEVENIDLIDMDKLCDRFYKVDRARSRKLGGTGLGLAITRMILNLHGLEFGFRKRENRIEFYLLI